MVLKQVLVKMEVIVDILLPQQLIHLGLVKEEVVIIMETMAAAVVAAIMVAVAIHGLEAVQEALDI